MVSQEHRCWTGKEEANVFPLSPDTTEIQRWLAPPPPCQVYWAFLAISHDSIFQNKIHCPFLLTGWLCWNINSCSKLMEFCNKCVFVCFPSTAMKSGGTQLKLIMTFQNYGQALFKPMKWVILAFFIASVCLWLLFQCQNWSLCKKYFLLILFVTSVSFSSSSLRLYEITLSSMQPWYLILGQHKSAVSEPNVE